jgi:hypothetical protein
MATLVLGIEPGEYEESLAAVTSAMVAGFCGLLGFVGLAQRSLQERMDGAPVRQGVLRDDLL